MIRELKKEDKHDFLSVLSQLTDVGSYTTDTWNRVFDEISKNVHQKIFVKIINKKIVGTVSTILVQRVIHLGQPSGQIEDLVVDKDFRNRGIAKELVSHAINYLKNKNAYKITLTCDPEIKPIYQNLGFCVSDINMRLKK